MERGFATWRKGKDEYTGKVSKVANPWDYYLLKVLPSRIIVQGALQSVVANLDTLTRESS